MIIITKDGKEMARVNTRDEAFIWLLKHQGQSVHYALKYAGYKIEEEL